jgi:hypothetical protein
LAAKNPFDIIRSMDAFEQAEVYQYLKTNGYSLHESTLERLRFERKSDESEIVVLNSPTILPVIIKLNNQHTD